MKAFGGILGVLGFIAILGTLTMSTTATTIDGERVEIGLVGSKVMWLVGSCSLLILGTTIFCTGAIMELLEERTKHRIPDVEPPPLTASPSDSVFRQSQLDKEE